MIPFHDHDDLAMYHVGTFMTMSLEFGIKQKDVFIRLFVLGLKGNANAWLKGLGRGEFFSLARLVEVFCSYWCPEDHEKWMPYVEFMKGMIKEQTNEDPLESLDKRRPLK